MLQRLLMLGLVLGLASCATIEGAGEDLESAGEKIQESAEDNNE
ncbi:MAG: entericidin A/B family lipoprotein [Pseudomonadota bacterium]